MGLFKRRIIESEEPQEEPPMANTVDTDIVESLRYVAQSAKPVDAGQMRAAADEIERLRLTEAERKVVVRAWHGLLKLAAFEKQLCDVHLADARAINALLERTRNG